MNTTSTRVPVQVRASERDEVTVSDMRTPAPSSRPSAVTAVGSEDIGVVLHAPGTSGRCRTRMISFRVSEREFDALKSRSESEGARSISDYARLVLCGAENGERVAPVIGQLSEEIHQLSTEVRRVTALLEAPPRPTATPAPVPGTTCRTGRGVR